MEQLHLSDKSSNRRPTWQAVLAIVLVVAVFGVGFFTARTYFPQKIVYTGITNRDLGQPEDIDFSLFGMLIILFRRSMLIGMILIIKSCYLELLAG